MFKEKYYKKKFSSRATSFTGNLLVGINIHIHKQLFNNVGSYTEKQNPS